MKKQETKEEMGKRDALPTPGYQPSCRVRGMEKQQVWLDYERRENEVSLVKFNQKV